MHDCKYPNQIYLLLSPRLPLCKQILPDYIAVYVTLYYIEKARLC